MFANNYANNELSSFHSTQNWSDFLNIVIHLFKECMVMYCVLRRPFYSAQKTLVALGRNAP